MLPILNLIYHKYVLFFEFKYIFFTMQLKYNRQPSIGSSIGRILIKLFLALIFLIVVIFLIEKINFPSPTQKYKIDITDEINKLK